MKLIKSLSLTILTGLAILSVAITAQAQVVHRVHVGGPDLCEAFGLTPGCDANFSLSAIKFANGEVVGQFSDRWSRNSGFHAVIDCLSVDGNDAWVSGVVTQGHAGDFDLVGIEVAARVRDNGRSKNDPPDEISFSELGLVVPSCNEQLDYVLFDVPQGQVVVK